MADFFEKLKEGAEDVWDSAKKTFERDAADENAALSTYHDLFSWADGSMLALPYQEKEISEKDKQMQTLAVMLVKDKNLVAPCAGTVVKIEPAENTIILKTGPYDELGIKVCVGSVSFEKDARILVSAGQQVEKGDTLVHFEHPIEAKSKLFVLSPETYAMAKSALMPAAKPGAIHHGELIITSAKA